MNRLQQRIHGALWPGLALGLIVLVIGAVLSRPVPIVSDAPDGPSLDLGDYAKQDDSGAS